MSDSGTIGRGGICAAVMGAMPNERVAWRSGGVMVLEGNRKMGERNMAGDAWWDGLLKGRWLSAGVGLLGRGHWDKGGRIVAQRGMTW